jgi:hypothetical protein
MSTKDDSQLKTELDNFHTLLYELKKLQHTPKQESPDDFADSIAAPNEDSHEEPDSQGKSKETLELKFLKLSFKGLEELGRKKEDVIKELGELKLRRLFDSFDEDGGGTISEIEFVKACKNMRLNFHQDDLKLFFAEFDKDQNGDLDFEEFAMLVKFLRCGTQHYLLRSSLSHFVYSFLSKRGA